MMVLKLMVGEDEEEAVEDFWVEGERTLAAVFVGATVGE